MNIKYIFIEKLSLISLLKIQRLDSSRYSNYDKENVFYINSTKFTDIVIKIYMYIFSISVTKFNFRFVNLTNDDKSVYGFKKINEDILAIWNIINNEKIYPKSESDYYVNYFVRNIINEWPCYGDMIPLNRLLLMFFAAVFYAKNRSCQYKIIFLIDKRPWIKELTFFAKSRGIDIIEINPLLNLSKKYLIYQISNNKYLVTFVRNIRNIINYITHNPWKNKRLLDLQSIWRNSEGPTIFIDLVMQLFDSSRFWKSSKLSKKSIIFVCAGHKINQSELEKIRNNGMNFIALSKFVWDGLDAFYFYHIFKTQADDFNSSGILSWESKIIKYNKYRYCVEQIYWADLFNKCNTKIYATVHKWSNHHIPASEAINGLGGISVLWQSSFYETMSLNASVNTILYFAYSTKILQVEKLNNSQIKYLVAVGYVFDFNFSRAKEKSKNIENYLRRNNVKKIISIFDGGSYADERWGVGNTSIQEDYQFILEKVLENSWLGLIIKAKKPGSLRKRLGDVSFLLEAAVKTGRCFFTESTDNEDKNESMRPAEVAYASDIAIHFCMYAGSAGLEAALTNTPTLLLDKYNLAYSQFYKLEKGKVVFNDLTTMWDVIFGHFMKKPIPRLGDWSPIINDFDSFRDGKASERIRTYLHWMNQGFKQGLKRDVILADTAERYGKQWGFDKVISLE